MITRLIHLADSHLRDRQFSNASRGEDFTRAFNQAIDVAINTKVAAIIHGGDLLDSKRPSSKTMLDLAKIHARLVAAQMPMYVVNGDHDKDEPHWVDSMKDFGASLFQDRGIVVLKDQLITIPGTKITVYGMDYIGKTKERFLEIRDTLPKADILLWHTMIKEFAGFSGEQVASLSELPSDKYRLIALGDIHVSEYKHVRDCLVGYPGTTELCKKDEPLLKTVSLFEIPEAGPIAEPQKIPILTRCVKVYRLLKDEDVLRVITELDGIKDQNPMVFGRFDDRIPDVVKRIYAVLDPDKAIVRLQPLPQIEAPLDENNEVVESKGMADFLPEFLIPGTALFDVASACLRDGAPAVELLTEFVDKRLVAIGEAPSPL